MILAKMAVNLYGFRIDRRLLMAAGWAATTLVSVKVLRTLWTRVKMSKIRQERRQKRDKAIAKLKAALITKKVRKSN